jgi:hypothetical protein
VRVAILGCGPTGLAAAEAARMFGAEVTIYSKRRKSEMYGAQYLHVPIGDADCGPPAVINYSLAGTIDGYRRKVYGDNYHGSVSIEDYEGDHEAYDIRHFYNLSWIRWFDSIVEADITPSWIIGDLPRDYDYVFSTIPLPSICICKEHQFNGQAVWAMGDAPERGIFVPKQVPINSVILNGTDGDDWYRVSNIFGYKTLEWPAGAVSPLLRGAAKISKPLDNTCDCWPNLTRIGRFGMWRKGILVHNSFSDALDILIGNLIPADMMPR